MKTIPTALLLLALPLAAQQDPFGGKESEDAFTAQASPQAAQKQKDGVIPRLHLKDTPLEFVFEEVSRTLPEASNVVFKDGAEEIQVSLNLRNVTLDNLLKVLEALTEARILMVESNKEDAYPGVIFVQAPRPSIRSAAPAAATPTLAPRPVRISSRRVSDSAKPPHHPSVTRAYQLNKVNEKDAISAISAMWESAAPEWKEKDAAFSFHAASSLLLVRAPEDRQEEAADILEKMQASSALSKHEQEFRHKQAIQEERMQVLEESMRMRIKEAEERYAQQQDRAAELMKELQVRELELAKLRATIEELEVRKKER